MAETAFKKGKIYQNHTLTFVWQQRQTPEPPSATTEKKTPEVKSTSEKETNKEDSKEVVEEVFQGEEPNDNYMDEEEEGNDRSWKR